MLSSELRREAVARAIELSPEERLRDGFVLYAGVCERMKDGIRMRFPEMNEEQVHEQLRKQLARLDRVEEKLCSRRS